MAAMPEEIEGVIKLVENPEIKTIGSHKSMGPRSNSAAAVGFESSKPAKPAKELSKINKTDTAAAPRVLHQRVNSNSGVRNMPPPVPVKPANKPSNPPAKNNNGNCTCCKLIGSFGF